MSLPAEKLQPETNSLKSHSDAGLQQLAPATLWKRFAASFIDGLICTVFTGVTTFVLKKFIPNPEMIINFGLLVFYYALFTWASGQTLGKQLLGLVVIRKEGDPQLNFFSNAIVREVFGKVIGIMFLGLGYIWVLFNKERRAWHDLMSGTIVVEK